MFGKLTLLKQTTNSGSIIRGLIREKEVAELIIARIVNYRCMRGGDQQRRNIIFDDDMPGGHTPEDNRSRAVSNDLSAKTRPTAGPDYQAGERKFTAVNTQENSVVDEDYYQRRQPRLEAAAAKYQDYFVAAGNKENSGALAKSTMLREPNFSGINDGSILSRAKLPHETLTFQDGTYFGRARSHMPNGYGMFWFNSGDVFVGNWVSGVPEGHGYYYMVEGGLFFGQISNGFANGFGIYSRPQDQMYYQGNFDAGYLDGKGFLHSKNQGFSCIVKTNRVTFTRRKDPQTNKRVDFPAKLSSIEDEMAFIALVHNPEWRAQFQQASKGASWQNIYFGEKNQAGQMHGIGTLLRSDGSRFHGIFVDDKPTGFGVTVDKELSTHIGFFSAEGPSLFGSRSQPTQGSLFCGGWSRGLFEGPGIYHLTQQNRWMVGFFQKGNLVSKSYTSDSKPEENLLCWGHELQVILLKKAFGEGGKVLQKSLGCMVLSGRVAGGLEALNSAHHDPNVQVENSYLRKVWKKYLEGTEQARVSKFTGEDWESRSKSAKKTKDMYKQVFTSYLKPEPRAAGPEVDDGFSFREPQKLDTQNLKNRQNPRDRDEDISEFSAQGRPRGQTFGETEDRRMNAIDPMRQLDNGTYDDAGSRSPEFKKPDFAFLNDL